jgi:3'-phosphoadenosine 5'-phosphosulfate sulfotransferase (PAPS reductase)/FAD synthetase
MAFYRDKKKLKGWGKYNMNKPLKDWTLKEVQEYCRERKCSDCLLYGGQCKLCVETPNAWHLTNLRQSTEQEKEYAKVLLKAFGNKEIRKYTSGYETIAFSDPLRVQIELESDMFPSIELGDTVTLKEIAGLEG